MNRETKPIPEFTRLEQCLLASGVVFELSEQRVIYNDCYDEEFYTLVLQKGSVAIHRQQDDLLLEIVTAPFIFGLNEGMMESGMKYTLITQSACTGFYLPAQTARNIIQHSHLWREAFCWLSWINRLLEIRDGQLIGSNSYGQIRATLLDMANWDEVLRSQIGVMAYIQRRTRISRSVIADVLAALRKGNYINMKQGKLVSISHLPVEY
ncbi:helix-turn-helix domain-containing protein [Enterobacteriaceae bacterium BIT-l23]|uniref:helix-turn-helix domain-containing protein n=1 Tax=Jejubacter sp. L23 TaxID=3092086 RepID=UPI001584D603|nr:helix-turn-helix domain-containing protein [Enterobacteriaceae bacterium BIT-l23]